MQPIKLDIEGQFWDSQIYSGILYLFTLNGEIISVNWDRLLDELNIEDYLKLALTCSFSRSDYLYNTEFSLLFNDPEVKQVIISKFSDLSNKELFISKSQIERCTLTKQNNPFPFPHSDSIIYRNSIYTSSKDGIHRATCNRRKNKYVVSTKKERKWDAPSLSISANYRSLAIAAGDEGLYQIGLESKYFNDESNFREPKQLSSSNCSDCGWTFYSIFASSHLSDGYHAAFEKKSDNNHVHREFKEIKYSGSIFNETGYSWGMQDKIYLVKNDKISIIKYSPWHSKDNREYGKLGEIQLENWKGNFVSAKNALFGILVECENAIIVKLSDGDIFNIHNEPVNWRVFPASKRYEN